MSHGIAVELEAEDQRRSVERNRAILDQWEERFRRDYREMTEAIFFALWNALWLMVILAVIAFVIGFFLKKIDPSWRVDPVKLFTFIGSFLMGWAALMELGGNLRTWGGVSLPELTHPVIFKMIFTPGVLLVLASILL